MTTDETIVIKAPASTKSRKASERLRKREAGLKPMEVWAHPGDHAPVKAYAAKLAAKRKLPG